MMRLGARTLLAVAVVAAVIGLLFWVWRRRAVVEGWEYEGDQEELSPGHELQVQRWCLEGRKASKLQRDDAYMHLQKYTKSAVKKVCDIRRKMWRDRARGAGDLSRDALKDKCPGDRVCGTPALRVTHPCANLNGDKCCLLPNQWDGEKEDVKYLKNCVRDTGFAKSALMDGKKEE